MSSSRIAQSESNTFKNVLSDVQTVQSSSYDNNVRPSDKRTIAINILHK